MPTVFAKCALAALVTLPMITATRAAAPTNHDLSRLLDADTPQAERTALFDDFRQRAQAGGSYAQYVVGSLYRAGDHLPHGIVPADANEAARYLSTAAAHGYLNAMTKMAEIELARGHAVEAMVWAQLYAHYSGAADAVDANGHSKPNEFLAGLLHRIYQHVDDAQMAEIDRDLNAFVDAHDADIRAGMGGSRSPTAASKRPPQRFQRPPTDLGRQTSDTQADYVIAFGPDGKAQQAWLLDAVPDMHTGMELKVVALRMHFKPDASAPPLRYTLVPVRLTYKEFSLRDPS